MDDKNKNNSSQNDIDSAKASLISMMGSLAIVGFVLLFMFGFNQFLKTRTYTGPVRDYQIYSDYSEESEEDEGFLDYDQTFEPSYIVMMNLPKKGLYADVIPGKQDKGSIQLEDGQVLKAEKRGLYEQTSYYELDNGFYVKASSDHILVLDSYEPRSGYIDITYISSNGVRLRKWPDFTDDDNIEKYVFVGDQVDITGKVVTAGGVSAYQTAEGLYITTDSQYFKDFTKGTEEIKQIKAPSKQ